MVASGRQYRKHRSRTEADRLAVAYEASGLSQKEFCQQRDLPLKTLGRYLTRYRKQKGQSNEPHNPQRFVAVEVAGPRCGSGELTVLLSGGCALK
jgi:hypothetical protein